MKTKICICSLIFVVFISCKQPVVTFTESQPLNKSSLSKIPNRLYGKYFSVSDSAHLLVDRNLIRKFYHDSLGVEIYVDTILNLAGNDQIKKYKGYYFLNSFRDANDWEVQKVKFKNGILSISQISSEEEIAMLEEITETLSDSIRPYTINPNKKQFKEFLKKEGFADEDIYILIK